MNIHIFGGSNPSGKSFLNLLSSKSPSSRIFSFSRKSKFNYVDLDDASTYKPKNNEEYVLISFAPIWKISNFLQQLYSKDISLKGNYSFNDKIFLPFNLKNKIPLVQIRVKNFAVLGRLSSLVTGHLLL